MSKAKPLIPRGDTFWLIYEVVDLDGKPVDLSNLNSASWYLATSPNTVPQVVKTLTDGISVLDAEAGEVQVALEPMDTALLPSGDYYHQLTLVMGDETRSTVVQNYLTILPNIVAVP